jgi:hypothetical protein
LALAVDGSRQPKAFLMVLPQMSAW